MTVHAGDRSALLFLDLSDTFDTVDHEICFERLSNHCGVTDITDNWFRSYHNGRTGCLHQECTVRELSPFHKRSTRSCFGIYCLPHLRQPDTFSLTEVTTFVMVFM
jgi:hypothetical protein